MEGDAGGQGELVNVSSAIGTGGEGSRRTRLSLSFRSIRPADKMPEHAPAEVGGTPAFRCGRLLLYPSRSAAFKETSLEE